MNCLDVVDWIRRVEAGGEAPAPGELSEIAEHMERCAACAARPGVGRLLGGGGEPEEGPASVEVAWRRYAGWALVGLMLLAAALALIFAGASVVDIFRSVRREPKLIPQVANKGGEAIVVDTDGAAAARVRTPAAVTAERVAGTAGTGATAKGIPVGAKPSAGAASAGTKKGAGGKGKPKAPRLSVVPNGVPRALIREVLGACVERLRRIEKAKPTEYGELSQELMKGRLLHDLWEWRLRLGRGDAGLARRLEALFLRAAAAGKRDSEWRAVKRLIRDRRLVGVCDEQINAIKPDDRINAVKPAK